MVFVEKRAKELYESSSGLSKPADQFGYGYPFLSYSDVFHNYYAPAELTTLVNSTEKDRKSCSIKRGDVFLTRTSETTEELGMSCVALKDYPNATFNGFTKRLRPITDEIVPEYAAYFFRSSYFRSQCMAMASLITRASLNDGMIGRFRIRYPKSKEVQTAIGTALMSYDRLIEVNNKRIKLLEQMAENLYKEWFVRFRFPGHETAEFENGIPKGWELKRLSNVANIVMGQSPSSNFYNDEGIGMPFHQGVGSYGDFYLEDTMYSSEGARIAEPNSIIFSVRAPVGRINITRNKIILGRGVASINSKLKRNAFLFWQLKNSFAVEDAIGNGSIFASVTKEELLRQRVLVPDDKFQKLFESFAEKIERLIRTCYLANQKLIRQRDLLLPRLMGGKLGIRSAEEQA